MQVQRESADPSTPSPGSGDFARAIVQTIRQPLIVLDERYRVVSANPAFYRHFGVPAEDTVGRLLWELGDRQWDEPALRELLSGVLAEHETVEDFEVRHEFQRLGPRVFLVNARQVSLEGEGYRFLLVAFEDVTERRRAERLLMRYTDQLRRSNRDLEEFAHAASHDLQEPLRKVRTFADRLVGSVDAAALDERQRLYLDRIEDATRRMQQRIDDLLDLARVARAEMRHEDVDLGAVATSVLRDLESAVAETSAEIDVGPLPGIEGDAAHLELVFQNLLANALKYREADAPPRVRIASSPAAAPDGDEREWISITVSDEGIGFEQQYAERIFRPFERLHGRTEYEGSGVGLSVCRRIVEAHSGRIRATGEPGEGATFEILLPTTQKELEG